MPVVLSFVCDTILVLEDWDGIGLNIIGGFLFASPSTTDIVMLQSIIIEALYTTHSIYRVGKSVASLAMHMVARLKQQARRDRVVRKLLQGALG